MTEFIPEAWRKLSAFQIGTSYETIASISQLFMDPLDTEPTVDPLEYAETKQLASGARRSLGRVRQVWHWQGMSEGFRNNLYALANTQIYIYTRANDGTMAYFSGLLLWPEKEPEHNRGWVLDVSIEITNLVTYTPEA